MKAKILAKNIGEFYLTVIIPLLYLAIWGLIAKTPSTFPLSWWPVMQWFAYSASRYASLFIAGIGVILWLWSFYSLRHEFGVLPHRPKQVVTSGPYRYLRHPMYLGIFLTFTGLALANLSVPGLLANWLALTPINWWRGRREGKLLRGVR